MLTNSRVWRGGGPRTPSRSAAGDRLGLHPGRRELAPGGEPLIRCGNRRAKSTEAALELLREPRLLAQPSTAFQVIPPVHRTNLQGALRVDPFATRSAYDRCLRFCDVSNSTHRRPCLSVLVNPLDWFALPSRKNWRHGRLMAKGLDLRPASGQGRVLELAR